MAELETQSPPRRRRRPAGSSIANSTHQSLISLPSLATVFHGLPPAQPKHQSSLKAAVEESAAVTELQKPAEPERLPGVASRPPTRPAAPLPPLAVDTTSNVAGELEPDEPLPAPVAARASAGDQGDASSSLIIVRPIARRAMAPDESEEEEEVIRPSKRKKRTTSAQWAARVLSPIVRQEQMDAERSNRRRPRSSSRVVDDSEEDSQDDRLPLSVDAYLAAAVPRAIRSAKKQYGSKGKGRKGGTGSSSSRKSKSSAQKRPRATVRDYTSDSEEPEQDSEASEWADPLPRRSARTLSTAPKPRRLGRLPRFAGASGIQGGGVKPPYEYKHRAPSLELDRASQMEDEEEYGRIVHKKDRRVRRVEPGKGHAAFLASLNDTAFVSRKLDKGKGRAVSPELGVGEGDGVELTGEGAEEGRQRITSRIFSPSEIARLDAYEEVRGIKRRKLANGKVARFPALELEPIGEDDFASLRDNEDPFFAAQKAAMPQLSFADQDRASAEGRPPTPIRPHATKKGPSKKPLLLSIEEKSAAMPPQPRARTQRNSPVPSKRVAFSSANVKQMQQSFDRRLKPTTLVPNTDSTAYLTARPPPTAPSSTPIASSPEPEAENEVDPIAVLPTPVPPSFRFVTGSTARVPRKLELVEEEQPYHQSQLEERPMEDGEPRARLDLVTEEEYEAERELERAMNDDWDPLVLGAVSAMAQEAEAEFQDQHPSFDFHRDTQESPSPSPPVDRSSPAAERLKRRVTFSSPLAPHSSNYPRRRATTSLAPVKRTLAVGSGNSSKSPARPLRRAQSMGATPRKATFSSSSGAFNSSGKLLRRLSTRPEFRLPSSPSRASVPTIEVESEEARSEDYDIHESSHEYIDSSPEPEQLPQVPSIDLPPAAQPHSDIQLPLEDAALPSSASHHDPSVDFHLYAAPSIDFLAGEGAGEPSVDQLVAAAELEDEGMEVAAEEGVLLNRTASSERYTGDDLWDNLQTVDQPDLMGAARVEPRSSPPRPQFPSPRFDPYFIPSDPTALVSLPPSARANPVPKRATTVWGGVRLSGLGRLGLTELVALKG